MGRVTWDDNRKVRLSPAAVELLRRMCSDGISIHYESRAGKYTRLVNGISEVVQSRTVDALARAGVIARLKDETPSYAANERARELVKRTEEMERNMDLKTMTDSELEQHLATLTDAEVTRLSVDKARDSTNRRGEIGPDESRRINRCHRERARRFTLAESASRNADREARTGTKPEIKAPASVSAQPSPANSSRPANQPSAGEAAIAEIKRIKEHSGGTSLITIFSAAEHEARMNHVLKIANQSIEGESMSKPEPPVTVIAEKARDYQKQQHAKGNRFYSIAEAVNHVRQEMGLSNDTLATDADMTRRAHAQD
jgi:hypothetical protein